MSSYPKIEPIKLKNYASKQSKYAQCAKLPMRSIVFGPSGSGKTILLQNMYMTAVLIKFIYFLQALI